MKKLRVFFIEICAMPLFGNLSRVAAASSDDIPFWGCGLLGQLPGINSHGGTSGGITTMIEGLKATNPYNKVSFWNWNLAPMHPADGNMEYLTKDFLFMPEQWGTEPVKDEWVRTANSVGFLDSEGQYCPATMADIFLGANEPDIYGSCMGNMMGACRAPCTPDEVAANDCPVAHLNEPSGSASPNSNGHCDCWSDSHATGCGFWPVEGVANPQPLPTCWDQPDCAAVQIDMWKKTAATAVAKGYRYLSTPLVAVNMEYLREFLKRACSGCTDISCGCPTHIGWHFYANDCLSGGVEGYNGFQEKLDKTVEIMEEFPFLKGAIVNEVGMLNCAMKTADAICIPNGPDQVYPANQQPNHACPSTPTLPNGMSSFIEELLRRVSQAVTRDGRRAITSFTWFNLNMAGGTYNLQLFNDDGSLNDAGRTYIDACQSWANGSPMPTPSPSPSPTPSPTPAPAPSPTPTPTPSPSPSGQCAVGDVVACPGNSGAYCAGDQCCPDGTTCPSASNDFTLCSRGKQQDCTTSPPPSPSPTPSGTCSVGDEVNCPGFQDHVCAGNQCCPGGDACPSAGDSFNGCPLPKKSNCLQADKVLV